MKKTFENQWQEAFRDVDVPAPEGSWPWIEAELDKKKTRPIWLLWPGSNVFKYAAACLLVLGVGVYMFTQNTKKPSLAQADTARATVEKSPNTAELNTEKSTTQTAAASTENSTKETTSKASGASETKAEIPVLANNDAQITIKKIKSEPSNQQLTERDRKLALASSGEKSSKNEPKSVGNNYETTDKAISDERVVSQINVKDDIGVSSENNLNIQKSEITKYEVSDISLTQPGELAQAIITRNEQIARLDLRGLDSKALASIPVKAILPRPYLSVEDFTKTDLADAKKPKDKMWFGLLSGVSPFNPSYSSQTIAANFFSEVDNSMAYSVKSLVAPSPSPDPAAAKTSNPNLPYDEFSNGISRNYGIEIGRKIRKNWTFAGILRVSNARINQRTNVFSVDKNSGNVNTFYQSSYSNSGNTNDQLFTAIPSDNVQRFRYLQVPVFVAYQFPIIDNLEVEFQMGVSNDIFLGSKITGDIIKETNFTNRNSRFKMLNFSGLGGMGFNLKVSRNWRAVVQGNFQKAIFSGTKSELDFRPRFLGINYGLRYVM